MQRFKNILVVFNDIVGDDDTLTQATALAQKNDAQLTVVEVIKDTGWSSSFIEEREKHLRRLTTSFRHDVRPIQSVVLIGTPFLEIIRQVLSNKHDLVMMTAEGGGGYAKLFFGSTSLHLIRKCPCPVWVTKPEAKNDGTRIMAALDLDSDAKSECELNIKIMDLATSLAHLIKGELHIVNAWEVTGKDQDTLKSEFTDEMKAYILHTHETRHKNRLDRLLARYDFNDIKCHVNLMRGTPEYILPKIADTSKIDLIVMGTIGRTGIPGFFIGTSAELILRQVQCGVLAVKPQGFITPVTLS